MSMLRPRKRATANRRDRRCVRVNGAGLPLPAIAMDDDRQCRRRARSRPPGMNAGAVTGSWLEPGSARADERQP
jgi:hypothetical protein